MKINKRNIKLFLIFGLVFLIIIVCVLFLTKSYTNTYKINNYKIKEVYTEDEKGERDNYYIEISANNVIYNYQFYKEIKDNNKIVKDVIYYSSEYSCLLPILSDNIKVDFLCYKDSKYYNYQDIKGKDKKLDKYISNLDKKIYNESLFKDYKKNAITNKNTSYYNKYVKNKYYLSLTTLKGITIYKDDINNVKLFKEDDYNRKLSTYYNDYYVSANYNDSHEFSELYIVDLRNEEKSIIKTPDYISFDSYIQGYVDNSIYIYDIDNSKQYELNLNDKKIKVIGNHRNGVRYYDGEWKYISIIKAESNLLFKDNNIKKNGENIILKLGNKLSGYIYYFEKVDNGYDLYKSNVQNNNIKKYIFNVKKYEDVLFIDDYIFYKKDDSIKMYSEYTGKKTIIVDKELKFNKNIKFYVDKY